MNIKPHIKRISGRWYIYRHKSAASYQLPILFTDSAKTAYQNYLKYMGLSGMIGNVN